MRHAFHNLERFVISQTIRDLVAVNSALNTVTSATRAVWYRVRNLISVHKATTRQSSGPTGERADWSDVSSGSPTIPRPPPATQQC